MAVAMGAAKDHRLNEWLSKKTQNKHGKGLDLKCRCGVANPTRRHWAWDCTEFKCSPPAESPECQLGEALGVPLVPKPRKPRPAREECVQRLVDALVRWSERAISASESRHAFLQLKLLFRRVDIAQFAV